MGHQDSRHQSETKSHVGGREGGELFWIQIRAKNVSRRFYGPTASRKFFKIFKNTLSLMY